MPSSGQRWQRARWNRFRRHRHLNAGGKCDGFSWIGVGWDGNHLELNLFELDSMGNWRFERVMGFINGIFVLFRLVASHYPAAMLLPDRKGRRRWWVGGGGGGRREAGGGRSHRSSRSRSSRQLFSSFLFQEMFMIFLLLHPPPPPPPSSISSCLGNGMYLGIGGKGQDTCAVPSHLGVSFSF